jgi:ssDNA-binding Zn-finger/Zn-ribbon topoisomerase 1
MGSNPHNLPPCPKCGGETMLGKAMSGMKIFCKQYHKCGGIIHSLTQPKSAVALSGGYAEKDVSSLEPSNASKKVEPHPRKIPGVFPSPGSANYGRMQQ